MQKDPSSLETLDIPSLNHRGLANEFGASMILMMTGIGTSHLITAPVAGGRIFRSENPGPKPSCKALPNRLNPFTRKSGNQVAQKHLFLGARVDFRLCQDYHCAN